MNAYPGDIKIFTCNAHPALAAQIAKRLGIILGRSSVSRFSDGEISMKVDETVRGADVFVIQPTCPPVNENLMELLIMVDALHRASAGRITAVMPYYGYARQDRKARSREPITAKLIADLIATAGADRVLSMDLHCEQIQGFFNIPVDHLRGISLFTQYYGTKISDLSDVIVVSPDLGSVSRARLLAARLDTPLAIVDKRRPKANVSEIMNIIGNVEGKRAILLDDMIDTGGSITNAANALKSMGAKEVLACCTHAVLSGPAIENIEKSAIEELVILDTIPLPEEKKISKIKVISVAVIFSDAINRIHDGISISTLFE
ncbi:MAG: ribose-phosphate pyrophosphokinase [Clostridiales bacterium]|nr:ribose-phosphate pyrophosphokinase [Clostridiales bacterium]MDR2752483.1 ribose-phosphate pyrophosphokinase [Clostridiales bacterium]